MSHTKLNPAGAGDILQPLREVGTTEKSGFWDVHDVIAALRLANRLGIPVRPLSRANRTRESSLRRGRTGSTGNPGKSAPC